MPTNTDMMYNYYGGKNGYYDFITKIIKSKWTVKNSRRQKTNKYFKRLSFFIFKMAL